MAATTKDLAGEPGHHVKTACQLPYGAAPNIHNTDTCASLVKETVRPVVNVYDRTGHAECRTISLIAEYSMPLSMAPVLIEYAQEMSQDAKVLNNMSMSRTAASYKLKDGLQTVLQKRLVRDMKDNHFSINVDECTNSSNDKVFTILVSYFSSEVGEVVVKHYDSTSLKRISAQILYRHVVSKFADDDIPLDNLISCLSDSANYMRGKTAGFETLLRKDVPHLMDIDGDTCHHVHNSVKVFCKHFGSVVEKLDNDIHSDCLYGTDLRSALQDVCGILGVPYNMPKRYIPHRWLSVYDATVPILQMIDALTVIYYAWIPANLKSVYNDIVTEIYERRGTTSGDKKVIKRLREECLSKQLTEDGKQRKKWIIAALFFQRKLTFLHLNFYVDVLPLFKSFVLMFEQKEPMVHRLHEEQTDLVQNFLACFIRHEHLKGVSASDLKNLAVDDKNLHHSLHNVYVGQGCDQILEELSQPSEARSQIQALLPTTTGLITDTVGDDFRKTVLGAFVSVSSYILTKFPLDNPALKYLAALDPRALGHSATNSHLKKLLRHVPTAISDEEKGAYKLEVSKIQLDTKLPPFELDGKLKRLDHWWSDVFKTERYPVLSKVAKACLSIFTAPRIEQSFSAMKDIINAKTNRLDMQAYSAIQTVRYDLRANNTTTLAQYKREDVLRDPVDSSKIYHIHTASQRYKKRIAGARTSAPAKAKKTVQKKSVHQLALQVKKSIQKKRKAGQSSGQLPAKKRRV